MHIARTAADLADAIQSLPGRALVPTMGALHEGHIALVRAAAAGAPVVASIFVNPTQFGPGEDLARYPRDEAGDLHRLEEAGCALAFLPDVTDIYPPGDATTIEVTGPALGFEGERRPGHFRGVATVVARLFGLAQPATAWFGQKDWQQLQVIRRMVADLHMPVTIRDVPTQRAPDGLALSSRNRFLTERQRALAPALARIATRAAGLIGDGQPIAQAEAEGTAGLEALGFDVDYFAAVTAASMQKLTAPDGEARLVVAARLGSVRLLDNFPI